VNLPEALEVLARHRGDRVVITTMSSVGVWPEISDSPLDFAYLPSSMGQGIPLGLGLALAQPRGVIAISGDGSLLMNLGCLVTVASHPANLTILLIDNGLYEVTGGQDVAGAGRTDYPALARATGINRTYSFGDPKAWEAGIAEALAGEGPRFIHLKVQGEHGKATPAPPRPMAEQIERMRGVLQT
jgi:thiamine pyrophosphate-dependent acetolactate synthase large subunit-like protein